MSYPFRAARSRALAVLAVGAALTAGLAACSSSSSGGDDAGKATASSGGSTDSALSQTVASLEKELDAFPVPTDSVDGVADLAGGTVYYIPITSRAPQFAVTQQGLTAAAKAAGLKVQLCDGEGTPTAISACVTQAQHAKAAGIVLDGLAYDMAANAIDAAQKAGVPVVLSNQLPSDRHPVSATFAYAGTAGSPQMVALADWIALDSDGKANVLINEATDGESQIAYVDAGIAEFKKVCPGCTVTVNKISSASFQQIPSSTSSALLKNPDIDYVISEFAEFLQPTQQGVQQASAKVTMTTGASALSTLKELKGGATLAAATAQAAGYQGWVDLDAILRLHAGQTVPDYEIPSRLFTPESAGSLTLTSDAEVSGEWFAPTTYTSDFQKLWGMQ
ncbi:substrate-binding domain-containing protein [Microbacterium sp. KR10-403]|uniref:sugar ABC transporter substrate-binding protein n=1 Tax=Microbacterium sp. KR10-403 TaxID=3158581 RepID=UPI0032E496E3